MRMPKAWSQVLAKPSVPEVNLEPQAELPKWWTGLSDEAKEEYVAEHPNSKYSELHQKVKEAKPNDSGRTEHEAPKENSAPAEDKGELKEGNGEFLTEDEVRDHARKALQPSGEPQSIEHILDSKEMAPSSPARKKVSHFLMGKSKDILGHLKHEAKEWKTAGSAFAMLAKGQKLDMHHKKAVAAVAADLANVTIAVLMGGALVHGAQEVAKHLMSHLAQEAVVKAAVKGSVHTARVLVLSGKDKDETAKIMEEALKIIIKELESGDLKKYLDKAIQKSQSKIKSGLEARLDMSADVAGRGLCPECKKPMQIVLAGESRVWACVADRISLPVPDGM